MQLANTLLARFQKEYATPAEASAAYARYMDELQKSFDAQQPQQPVAMQSPGQMQMQMQRLQNQRLQQAQPSMPGLNPALDQQQRAMQEQLESPQGIGQLGQVNQFGFQQQQQPMAQQPMFGGFQQPMAQQPMFGGFQQPMAQQPMAQQPMFGGFQPPMARQSPFGRSQQGPFPALGPGGLGMVRTPTTAQQPQPAQQGMQQPQPAQQGMQQPRSPFGRFGGAFGGRSGFF